MKKLNNITKSVLNTYTKRIITLIIIIALLDLQIPFILSAYGKDPLEDLAKVIVVEIIGVVLVYCLKSFFETREEENNKLKRQIRSGDITGFDDAEIIDSDEPTLNEECT